jgi:ribonuclease III
VKNNRNRKAQLCIHCHHYIQYVDQEMNPENIAMIEERLNYTFNDKSLLIRALTRKAFAQEQRQQGQTCEEQEIYRILGDAVLKAILVEMLIQQGYDSRESITNKKKELENRENLAKMFKGLDITRFIRFGRGEENQGISSQSSVLGETFEALVAAVHLDSGSYEKTRSFVIDLFSQPVSENSNSQALNQSTDSDAVNTIRMVPSVCSNCFQPDVCTSMRMCHFEITGDD